MNQGRPWTESELTWLHEHYHDKNVNLCEGLPGRTNAAIVRRASYLGLKRICGRTRRRYKGMPIVNEELVCQQYKDIRNIDEVARLNGIGNVRVIDILKRHDVSRSLVSKADPYREAIIADYRRHDMSVAEITHRYGLGLGVVSRALQRWGEYDPSRIHEFRPCKSAYTCWTERYGEKEADKRNEEYRSHRKRGAKRGKDHHAYGKPPPEGIKYGRNGWYKGHHFRSLMEACYMIQLDALGIEWKPAENLVIPYRFQDGDHTYHPDFLVGNRLIEIKPKKRQTDPIVLAKRIAAEAYCSERGWTYEMIEVTVDYQQLFTTYTNGFLRFTPNYEIRFLKKMNRHNGLAAAS